MSSQELPMRCKVNETAVTVGVTATSRTLGLNVKEKSLLFSYLLFKDPIVVLLFLFNNKNTVHPLSLTFTHSTSKHFGQC